MEDFSINISVKKSNIPKDLAEIVNFHFPHYKSMDTFSCHSNQSSYNNNNNDNNNNNTNNNNNFNNNNNNVFISRELHI